MHAITTLSETNISPEKSILKMIFPFPQVGYVSSSEGTLSSHGMRPLRHSSSHRRTAIRFTSESRPVRMGRLQFQFLMLEKRRDEDTPEI